MSTCSAHSKIKAEEFIMNIHNPLKQGDTIKTTFESAIQQGSSDNQFLYAYILAGVQTNPAKLRFLARADSFEGIDRYLNTPGYRLPEETAAANMAKFLSIYPTQEAFDTSLASLVKTTVVAPSGVSKITAEVSLSSADGALLNAAQAQADTLIIDNKSNELRKRKALRKQRTDELNADSKDYWKPFLNTYFPGMSSVGADFVEWTRDKVYETLIDTSSNMGGFVMNINASINELKAGARKSVADNKLSIAYKEGTLDASVIKGDKAIRDRYFNEVFDMEFDFILSNLIKAITISDKATAAHNDVVSGFVDENGDQVSNQVMRLPDSLKRKFFSTVYNGTTKTMEFRTGVNAFVPNVLERVELDYYALEESLEHAGGMFYFTTVDERYVYKDFSGVVIDVSPETYYSYNTSSNKNMNSIDHFVDALSSDTTFVLGILPLFRRIDTIEGKAVFGERMSYKDLLTLAPFLSNAGRDPAKFIRTLVELSRQIELEHGRIAKSFLFHFFDNHPSILNGGDIMYSINMAAQRDPTQPLGINNLIVNTMQAALSNKAHIRYLKVDEGRGSLTRGLRTVLEGDVVNVEFAAIMMTDGYTKSKIANMLHINNVRKTIDVRLLDGTPVSIGSIKTIEDAYDIANAFGIRPDIDRIYDKFASVYPVKTAESEVMGIVAQMVYIAAVNRRKDPLISDVNTANIFEHPNYIVMSPTALILGETLRILASTYSADTHKNVIAGGESIASLSTPNREDAINTQLNEYQYYNKMVNPTPMRSSVFLDELAEGIVKAKYLGKATKVGIVHMGEVISPSFWDVKIREEHAMIHGFLSIPDNVGYQFYVQPTNYSDKGTPSMHGMEVGRNLLKDSVEMKDNLILAYITYQANKNEDLQRMVIENWKGFIVGSYDTLYTGIIADGGDDMDNRLEALDNLRLNLLKDYSNTQGDFTKHFNDILTELKLSPDVIEFSDNMMDKGADYTTFPGASNVAVMKPHLGVRAKLYRNPETAMTEVLTALRDNRHRMDKLDVDSDRVEKALMYANRTTKRGSANIVTEAKDFYDRVYLINGIYGHSLKMAILGDESFFPAKYKDKETVDEYYSKVNAGERRGLEESGAMLTAQFKRAQSVLTRGSAYAQKETIEGFRRRNPKDNLLQYLDIFGANTLSIDRDKGVYSMLDSSYEFPKLKGKTLKELEGLGVISRFEDGQLVAKNTLGYLINFNVGADVITVPLYEKIADARIDRYDDVFAESLYELAAGAYRATLNSVSEAKFSVLNVGVNPLAVSGIIKSIPARQRQMTIEHYFDKIDEIKSNTSVLMPDLVPSMTIEDPASVVNLLNAMGMSQETMDGEQFMSPLLSLILDKARGGELGAFHTDSQSALKMIATTFSYGQHRQTLQKKSIKRVFTKEQMSKVGGIELYNCFVNMHSAIPFKQPTMIYTTPNRFKVEYKANNLFELYTKVSNNKYETDDSIVWEKVLNILAQNPLNLYSFVGYITFPTGQKTGHKKINKWSSLFHNNREEDKGYAIDYTANEYSYEVLTKDHDYDVTGGKKGAKIALLSQLVNAIPFGGLSDLFTQNLQGAMTSKMMLNRSALARRLEMDARKHGASTTITQEQRKAFFSISDKFKEGVPDISSFTRAEAEAYEYTLRTGLATMSDAAVGKNASALLAKIAKGKKIIKNEKGEDVVIENAYSLDSPAVRSKIMNTLVSALYKETINMKMSGFMSVASASNRTIVVYKLPSGRSVTRAGYIKHALKYGLRDSDYTHDSARGSIVSITAENIGEERHYILPYDMVNMVERANPAYTKQIPFGNITQKHFDIDKYDYFAVRTPDTITYDATSAKNINAADDNAIISYIGGKKGSGVYKWYLIETLGKAGFDSAIKEGKLILDTEERFNLAWAAYTDVNGLDIKDTKEYRDMYRLSLSKNPTLEELDRLRSLLIIRLQDKAADGTAIWSTSPAEAVLPTYMAKTFGLTKGMSLYDVIGTDGADMANAIAYFEQQSITKSKYQPLTNEMHYTAMVKRIYATRAVKEREYHVTEIYDYLDKNELGETISPQGVREINNIINKYKVIYLKNKAKGFIDSLDVIMAHIPGQGKQSGFVARCLEFMDAQGNAAHAATEHMLATGGDYDIDTFSINTRTIDVNGFIPQFESSPTDVDGVKNFDDIFSKYQFDLQASKERYTRLFANLAKENAEFLKVRQAQKAEKDLNRAKKVAEAAMSDEEVDLGEYDTKDIDDQIRRAESLMISPEKQMEIILKTEDAIADHYQDMYSNLMFDSISGALLNPDAAVETSTPISMSMFKPFIQMIREHLDAKELASIALTVDTSHSWAVLKDTPVASTLGMNVMRTSKRSAPHMHFGNPFSGTMVPNTVQVGKHIISREDIKNPDIDNRKEVLENIEIAVALYKEWLLSDKEIASFPDINGNPIYLDTVAPEQRAYIRNHISGGSLKGKKLLYMSEGADYYSHADALKSIVESKVTDLASGEDYSAIFVSENLAAQGKESIGVFATAMKILSAVTAAHVNYKANYKDKMGQNPFVFSSTVGYTDFITGEKVSTSRHGFADLDRFNITKSIAKSTQLQQKVAMLVSNDSSYDKKSLDTLIGILDNEIKTTLTSPVIKNKAVYIVTLVNTLLGTKLDKDSVKGKTADQVGQMLFKMLSSNPEMVAKAFYNVIGSQLSDNVLSQFLSAATDNTEVLILGKIKSNQLTNGVIASMLVLGYDVHTIISFIYDKDVSKVFDAFAEKVGRLEKVRPDEKSILEIIPYWSASVTSLIELLDISNDIHKFRKVRNLNEVNKVEQADIDAIIGSAHPELYNAIKNDTPAEIESDESASKVFKSDAMIFLHGQTSALFLNTIENKHKVSVLFKTSSIVTEIAARTKNAVNTYKSTSSYLSSIQVEGFFNSPVVTVDEKGVRTSRGRSGDLYTTDAFGRVVKGIVQLHIEENRRQFVRNFSTYIEQAKKDLQELKGSGNIALDQLGKGKTYLSIDPVVYIPLVKNKHATAIDLSIIYEGITELKTLTGNAEVDALQQRIYSNLSYYALIVSSGEIKKGSMIELFDEINEELSEFIVTLTDDFYKDMVPKSKMIKELIHGSIKFEGQIKARKKNWGHDDYDGGDELQYANMDYEGGYEGGYEGSSAYNEDFMDEETGVKYRLSASEKARVKATNRIVKGNEITEGNCFKINAPGFSGSIFYAHTNGAIAYRIFQKQNPEALAISTLPTTIDIKNIPKVVNKEINRTVYQIGLSAEYAGKPARILSYNGLRSVKIGDITREYQEYLITNDLGTQLVLGAFLMKENPNLVLSGNIMGPITSSNRVIAIRQQNINTEILKENVDNVAMAVVDSSHMIDYGYFTQDELLNDEILAKEVRLIGLKAKDVIVVGQKHPRSIALSAYSLPGSLYTSSNAGSIHTLIPSFYSIKTTKETTVESELDYIRKVEAKIFEQLNYSEIGTTISFYGITKGGDTSFKVSGGVELLTNALDRLTQTKILTTGPMKGKPAVFNGNFTINTIIDPVTRMTTIEFTRVKKNTYIMNVPGDFEVLVTRINPDTKGAYVDTRFDRVSNHAQIEALRAGYIDNAYSEFTDKPFGEGAKYENLVVVPFDNGINRTFIRRHDAEFNFNTYVELVHNDLKKGIFDSDDSTYYMKDIEAEKLAETIEKKNVNSKNKPCGI